MSVEFLRRSLLWCAVINYAILIVWFVVFVFAQDAIRDLHSRFFDLARDQFGALNYLGMAIYKIGVLLFNVVPCIVLYIVGNGRPRTSGRREVGSTAD